MGMTIDEIIDDLAELTICGIFPYTRRSLSDGHYKIITKQSLKEAIDIMQKYQKIEQIINNAKDSDGAVKYNWLYEQIKKVVEDATDRC